MLKLRYSGWLEHLFVAVAILAGLVMSLCVPYSVGLWCVCLWIILGIRLVNNRRQKFILGIAIGLGLLALLYPPFKMDRDDCIMDCYEFIGRIQFAPLFLPPLDGGEVASVSGITLWLIEFFGLAVTGLLLLALPPTQCASEVNRGWILKHTTKPQRQLLCGMIVLFLCLIAALCVLFPSAALFFSIGVACATLMVVLVILGLIALLSPLWIIISLIDGWQAKWEVEVIRGEETTVQPGQFLLRAGQAPCTAKEVLVRPLQASATEDPRSLLRATEEEAV